MSTGSAVGDYIVHLMLVSMECRIGILVAHASRAVVTCWTSVSYVCFLLLYTLFMIHGLYPTFIDQCACFTHLAAK